MRRWRSITAAALVCSWVAPVRATQVALSITSCDLDRQEIERLLVLELSGVIDPTDQTTRYEVHIGCAKGFISVALHDPLTRKHVERHVVPPPPEQPEPERLLALTVAQLYRSAWLELATDDAAPLPPVPPPASLRAIDAARAFSRRTLAPRGASPWRADLHIGPRWRALSNPVLLPRGELRLDLTRWAPLLLSGGMGLELADVARRNGSVDVRILELSLAAGYQLVRKAPWAAFSEMSLALAHVRLGGHDVAAGYEAGTVSKLGLDGGVGLGLSYQAERAQFALVSRAGVLIGGPVGLVDPRGDVSMNGAWLGLDFRIGLNATSP